MKTKREEKEETKADAPVASVPVAKLSDDDFAAHVRAARGEKPLIVVAKFAGTIKNKELAGAYVHVEGLRRSVRRMTQEDWQKDYDAWLAAPRR